MIVSYFAAVYRLVFDYLLRLTARCKPYNLYKVYILCRSCWQWNTKLEQLIYGKS